MNVSYGLGVGDALPILDHGSQLGFMLDRDGSS
jgi:hypothetical protein